MEVLNVRSKSYKTREDERETSSNSRPQKSDNKRKTNKSNKGRNSRFDSSAGLNGQGRDNDPNYYFVDKELAEQASQLSFQNMMGFGSLDGYSIPSICRVEMNPSPGVSYTPESLRGTPGYSEWASPSSISDDKRGINLMSSKLYTMLSTFTGRTSNYAPQDVAMMILAVSSVAELSECIRRAFGVALTYNPRNRNLPLGLLKAMGLNAIDFIANIPAYRMRFNVAMTRINQIPLLDNIAFIRKSREIYQRIYMDGTGPMSQIFFYQPRTVWSLEESLVETGSVLYANKVTASNSTNAKMEVWITLLENMITKLLESSTLNLIYADLLNMANKIKVPVWQFDYLAENYVVMPEFNANALLQFHHMRIMGDPIELSDNTLSITKRWIADPAETTVVTPQFTVTLFNHVICDPNKNNIVYNPIFIDRTYMKQIVDMPTGSPTLEDRIEALRFSSSDSGAKVVDKDVRSGGSLNVYYDVMAILPDHYVTGMTYFRNIDYSVADAPRTQLNTTVGIRTSDFANGKLDLYEKFYKHPLLLQVNSDDYKSLSTIYGDLDFYTIVDNNYLSRVNELMYTGDRKSVV